MKPRILQGNVSPWAIANIATSVPGPLRMIDGYETLACTPCSIRRVSASSWSDASSASLVTTAKLPRAYLNRPIKHSVSVVTQSNRS